MKKTIAFLASALTLAIPAAYGDSYWPATSGVPGSGTVTNFSAGTLSPLFTTSVATSTSTPVLSFILSNAGAHTVFGNTSGSSGAPAFTSNPSLLSVVLNGATSGTCTIGVPAIAGTGTVFTLPANNGTNGYVLKTDGSGGTSWSASAASALTSSYIGYGSASNLLTGDANATRNPSTFETNIQKSIGTNLVGSWHLGTTTLPGPTNLIGSLDVSHDTVTGSYGIVGTGDFSDAGQSTTCAALVSLDSSGDAATCFADTSPGVEISLNAAQQGVGRTAVRVDPTQAAIESSAHGTKFTMDDSTQTYAFNKLGGSGNQIVLTNNSGVLGTGTPSVPMGGTGATSFSSHTVLIGAGSGPIGAVGPGLAGIPLIGSGVSADPVFGTAAVAGGGTGASTLINHGVLVGQGSSPLVAVGPNPISGIPLIAQGSSADPTFGTALVAGGGTGATTLNAHGLLLGQGTSAITTVAPSSTTGALLEGAGVAADPAYSSNAKEVAGQLTLGTANTTPGSVVLEGNTSGAVTVSVPATAGTTTFVLPNTNGTIHDTLHSDGAGNTSWSKVDLANNITGTLPISSGGTGIGGPPSDGQLLIGNSGNYTLGSLSGGTNVTITNGPGSITISSTAGGGGAFGGNAADGPISYTTDQSFTAPYQINATTWAIGGGGANHTATYTGSPVILNATSSWALTNPGASAGNITIADGSGGAGGGGGVNGASNSIYPSPGAGPGGGPAPGAVLAGGTGGGFGSSGGVGGSESSSASVYAGGRSYQSWINGGSGGSGGGYGTSLDTGTSGGNGGAGGGALIVCAVGTIDTSLSTVINCKGGDGSNATAGSTPGDVAPGGGGGSGGLVMLASQQSITMGGTVDVTGGKGGDAARNTNGDAGGGAGGAGGRIVYWSPSNTITGTSTLAGGNGGNGIGAGTNGGIGGSGSAQTITGTPNLPILTWVIKTPEGGQYLDTLTNMEIACGRQKNNLVNISQRDLAWQAGKDLEGFCYYNMGSFEGSTCLGIGDEVTNNVS